MEKYSQAHLLSVMGIDPVEFDKVSFTSALMKRLANTLRKGAGGQVTRSLEASAAGKPLQASVRGAGANALNRGGNAADWLSKSELRSGLAGAGAVGVGGAGVYGVGDALHRGRRERAQQTAG